MTAPPAETNSLLGRLPADEWARLASHLHHVEVRRKDGVYERGAPLRVVYFPLDAVFSVVAEMDAGPVEVTTIGNEGMVGLDAFLGAAESPNTVFCQVPGHALRLDVADLREALSGDGALADLLRRYAQVVIVQLSQTVACNRVHGTEQRAARWLLMTHDRVGRDSFELTQEFFAEMLGVRRATVSQTAVRLSDQGLIGYRYGTVTIRDRAGLERLACECHRLVAQETRRLLGS